MNIQLFAFIIVAALGLALILRFSVTDDPFETDYGPVPASPAYVDLKKILNSINKCASVDQLRQLQDTADCFFDLHWKQIDPVILQSYWAQLMKAISEKQRELSGKLQEAT